MKEVDWSAYFNRANSNLGEQLQKEINYIIADLWQLDSNQNKEGQKIQKLLELKYFPDQIYDDRLREVHSTFEQKSDFTAAKNDLPNAHLAYHSISGRLDDLYEELAFIQLEQYPGIDLYRELEKQLSENPESFILKYSRNEPEGYTEYTIPVNKIEGDYAVNSYTASLTPYPPIDHGVFNGIDTRELEAKMQKIDWHDDRQLFVFHEDKEPEFVPDVNIIQEQMYCLSQDMVGSDIADQLQLKYWTDASFFEDMVQQTAWDKLEELPKRNQQFSLETEAKTAFNLLCGRAYLNKSIGQPQKMKHG